MNVVIIIAAVLIVVILFFPGKKKGKSSHGTEVWNHTPSMRIAQFAKSICSKIKDWIGG